MFNRRKRSVPYKHYIAVIFGTFIAGMLLNTLYQAERATRSIYSDTYVAAFATPMDVGKLELLRSKVANMSEAANHRFISSEEALRRAITEDSAVKDVILSGENPFPNYFLVRPNILSSEGVSVLSQSLEELKGIDEVRFDERIFNIYESIQQFQSFYKIELISVFIVLIFAIFLRMIFDYRDGDSDIVRYLLQAGYGLLFGIIGMAVFWIVTVIIFTYPTVSFPIKYYLMLIPVGILLNLVFKE